MKQRFSLLLLALLTAFTAFAAKEDLYVLHETFDGDSTILSQEYVSGQHAWTVENGQAVFVNSTSQTQHYATRLVTPVMDLSNTFQPVLVLRYAQPQRSGDVDGFTVYYRTDAASRWVRLKSYTKKQTALTNDTISLTAVNSTYQLAFEGTDNLGGGIHIDEIIVRPKPTCEDPNNISIDGLTANSATLRWNGSLDTDSFLVILADRHINSYETITEADVISHQYVYDFSCAFENLQRNTLYYAYIQAICGLEESELIETTFRTKNLAPLPYSESFDKEYAQNTVSHVDYWTYGTSIRKDDGSMEYMPFVNQNTGESSRGSYSYNSTTCLVFSGARSTSTVIPAGEYVYAATPELEVTSMANVHVHFWGTAYTYFGDDYESGLIVGVMTDPADWSTFVAVDTVYARENRGFYGYDIYMNGYTGEGKYVAFASNFLDRDNMFFLDEVEINETTVRGVTNVAVSNVRSTSLTVNANLNGNTSVELVIARDTINAQGTIFFNPNLLPQNYILLRQTLSASDFPYTAPIAQGGQFVQVYIRPAGENTLWSMPEKAQIPMHFTGEPIFTSFEAGEVVGNWTAKATTNYGYIGATAEYTWAMITRPANYCSTTPAWPSNLGTTYGNGSAKAVNLSKERQELADGTALCEQTYGDYIALAECDTVSQMMVRFYLKNYSSSTLNISRVAVGVMTDPFDPSTFVGVDTVENGAYEYKPFVVSLANYTGAGHFPAIMAVDAPNRYKYSTTSGSSGSYTTYKTSCQYVDDVTLSRMEGCIIPTAIKADPTHNAATITWTANGMTNWVVNVYSDAAKTTAVVENAAVTAPTYTVTGLAPHTTYWYTVATVCGEDTTAVDTYSFTTECAPVQSVPYIEDFEGYAGLSGVNAEIPYCWSMSQVRYSDSYGTYVYPYIYKYQTYAHSGSNILYFYHAGSTYCTTDQYFALPVMEANVNALQFSFWLRCSAASYVGDTLYVGVMSDQDDIATFDTVAPIRIRKQEYTEYIVRMDGYQGQGQHIALLMPQKYAARFYYIDDVRVDSLSACEKIQDVQAKAMTQSGATISWAAQSSSSWQVRLMHGEDVVKDTLVATNPFVIDYCTLTNETYSVAVRAVCDNSYGEWSEAAAFKTTCVPVAPADLGTIEFVGSDCLDCWTVGVREGATTSNLPKAVNQYLYLFNLASTDGAYAIMPVLDVPNIAGYEVSFDAHGGTGAAYLRQVTVGVITNPSDLSTFTAIRTLDLEKVTATTAATGYGFNQAYRYTVRFSDYDGDYTGESGKNIMFLSESGQLANYIYIDNVVVNAIPAVKAPVDLVCIEANTYDATLAWEPVGAAYNVQVLNGTTVVADTTVTDTTVVIAGLNMLTQYTWQVRTVAGSEYSEWSNSRRFTTACPVSYPVPYSENFDSYASGAANYPNCWERYTNSSTTYPYVYSSAKNGATGNGLNLYRNTSYWSVAVLPVFDAPLNQLMLEFDWRNVNTSTYTTEFYVGVAADVTSAEMIDSTVVIIDTLTAPSYKAPNNIWYHANIQLDGYQGQGQIVLIAPKAAAAASSGAIYLDNLYVSRIPSCFRPLNLSAAKAYATSVELSWTPQGNETAWDIAYVAAGGDIAAATVVTVDSTTALISGLTASTSYDFYVRSNCGAGDVSDWSDVATGTTLYIVTPEQASWNFDDNSMLVQSPLSTSATYKLQKDWITGNSVTPSSTNNPYVIKNTYNTAGNQTRNSHYSRSDSCALRIYSSTSAAGSYAILPEIVADLDTMQLHFFGRSCYATGSKVANADSVYYLLYATNTSTTKYPHAIKIGTVSDPYDISTFELITEYVFEDIPNDAAHKTAIVENAHWEEVIVPLYGAAGKYITFLSDYTTAANYVWIDDVTVEKETGCATPSKLAVTEITANSATFTWGSSKTAWQVELVGGDATINATVNARTWTATDLDPQTEYTFRVRAVCAEGEYSDWAAISCKTPCAPTAREDFNYNFAENLDPYFGNTSYQLPGCWDGGLLTGTSATSKPYAIANTTTYQYGRELGTTDRALRFYQTSTNYDSYVILPEMNFALDSVALHFFGRAAYFYTPTYTSATLRNRLYGVNKDYQKSLVIGAIADVEDITTFVALDTVTYSQTWTATTGIFTTGDPAGLDYWEEFIVPLKKYAGLGQIVILYPGNGKTGYFFIDDMNIVDADFCAPAGSLRANNITAHTADLAWMMTGRDSICLQIATDDTFEAPVVDVTIANATGHYNATGLNAGQDYYFRIKHFCGAGEEADWTVSPKFVTNYELRFIQNFSEARTYPTDWSRHGGVPADVFAGTAAITTITETGTNWTHNPGTNSIYAATSAGTASTNNYWLATPVIDLTAGASDSLVLSFNLWLTSSTGGVANPAGAEDLFYVALSTDEGQTWSQMAEIADAALTANPTTYFVELTQYRGQSVKLAFVSSSTKTASKNRVNLSAVSINTYTATVYSATVCQYEDYSDSYFDIDADYLKAGQQSLVNRYIKATANGMKDRIVSLTLNVLPATQSYLSYTVCEGSDFIMDGFEILDVREANTYKLKLTNANGCDSIVNLSLGVTRAIRTIVQQTICQGSYYEFNGVKYYTTTIHSDTLVAASTGCDSIVSLYLVVDPIIRGQEEVDLCPGQSVEFGKWGAITASGVYKDTLITALGCDSLVTLTVRAHEAAASTVRAAICQGSTYSQSVWAGLSQAGDYPSQQQTIYGCDSIVTLHLLVAGEDLTIQDSIAVKDLPYELNGDLLLPVGTADGDYSFQIALDCGIATLNIKVGKGAAPVDPEPEGIRDAHLGADAVKVVVNGVIYITVDGRWYDAQGRLTAKPE